MQPLVSCPIARRGVAEESPAVAGKRTAPGCAEASANKVRRTSSIFEKKLERIGAWMLFDDDHTHAPSRDRCKTTAFKIPDSCSNQGQRFVSIPDAGCFTRASECSRRPGRRQQPTNPGADACNAGRCRSTLPQPNTATSLLLLMSSSSSRLCHELVDDDVHLQALPAGLQLPHHTHHLQQQEEFEAQSTIRSSQQSFYTPH